MITDHTKIDGLDFEVLNAKPEVTELDLCELQEVVLKNVGE